MRRQFLWPLSWCLMRVLFDQGVPRGLAASPRSHDVTEARTLNWWITPFHPWQAALFSLLITMMGFLGGLVMSAVKRDRGVKDWGN